VPLERLLEDGVPDDEAPDASLALTPDQEIADLKRRLQAQQQRSETRMYSLPCPKKGLFQRQYQF
jgi:hypothetical protein